MEKPFCVIGQSAYGRTWCSSPEDAINHAAKLVSKDTVGSLYVVQVIKVVRPKSNVEILSPDEVP